ncbi:hypothetical protein VOLCADRAFT_104121 [Volvox carteri f. nagariensis]|uniref:Uncharacterized protein n=1 Tax=Volvox carteri f. nagariensis TaxID=3068 RepID=D8TRD1_VOLCA|nr:uncharacterized protein VOLCADRAFT_104121 [Volvox carteri f. nagariensis]EFJ49871.1 hypothetical protein VOLCADRAFT_104121 [Volvox carteri f. nagariensis]|eukprot:XP_002948936.1 hypothetical protein VOLCADRAFT_104121 [Volvox carteri f. nagariensis]
MTSIRAKYNVDLAFKGCSIRTIMTEAPPLALARYLSEIWEARHVALRRFALKRTREEEDGLPRTRINTNITSMPPPRLLRTHPHLCVELMILKTCVPVPKCSLKILGGGWASRMLTWLTCQAKWRFGGWQAPIWALISISARKPLPGSKMVSIAGYWSKDTKKDTTNIPRTYNKDIIAILQEFLLACGKEQDFIFLALLVFLASGILDALNPELIIKGSVVQSLTFIGSLTSMRLLHHRLLISVTEKSKVTGSVCTQAAILKQRGYDTTLSDRFS